MRNSMNKRIRRAFDRAALAQVCVLPEEDFASAYGMTTTQVQGAQSSWPGDDPADFYHFLDNGSNVLAVAHLDTVVGRHQRKATFVQTEAGEVVHSGALDDRLGAYIILELLPKLGVKCDVLLTVGEEQGNSTAQWFDPAKDYNWVIEFDRGGTDVVMYQFHDDETEDLVKDAGARVGHGSFSDIAFLDHLGVKAFNWGVGYQDYHSTRGHAYLDDTFYMVGRFMKFYRQNADKELRHYDNRPRWSSAFSGGGWGGGGGYHAFNDDRDVCCVANIDDLYDHDFDCPEREASVVDAVVVEDTPIDAFEEANAAILAEHEAWLAESTRSGS